MTREWMIFIAYALGLALADFILIIFVVNRLYTLHRVAMTAIREERARDWKFIFEEQEKRHRRELGDENWR